MTIRVIIADDHPLSRDGLRQYLQMEGDMEVVGEAANGRELLALLERTHPQPDVAVVDARMPEMDGLEATRMIRERFPGVGVLMLSAFDDQWLVMEALRAGARGYALKDKDPAHLVRAIRAAAGGEMVIDHPAFGLPAG